MMYSKKKCVKCGKQATHKFTRIQDNQIFDIYLCAVHAAEMSPYQKPKIPLSEILEGLLKQEMGAHEPGAGASHSDANLGELARMRCGSCGLTYLAYCKTLMLGCADCYASFHDLLLADLRKFHGDTRHLGRQPAGEFAEPMANAVQDPGTVMDAPPPPPPPEPEPAPAPMPKPDPVPPGEPELEDDLFEPEAPLPIESIFDLGELRRKMNAAIVNEDFATAARCRDRIRKLTDGGGDEA